ncbi:MAG: hypothetical protein AB1898_04510 [Acidobacteriota bacterium]
MLHVESKRRLTRVQFITEMARAVMLEKRDENKDYWNGYKRGLRRAFHGKAWGTEEEHRLLLSMADEQKEPNCSFALGYRDGFHTGNSD